MTQLDLLTAQTIGAPFQPSSDTSIEAAVAAGPKVSPQTEEESRALPRQTCTDHCAACGQHFHGLGAFDAHRQDGECVEPAIEALRRSKAGDARPALQVWTDDGWCRLWGGCYENGRFIEANQQHPVTIYQVATTEAQREALAQSFARTEASL